MKCKYAFFITILSAVVATPAQAYPVYVGGDFEYKYAGSRIEWDNVFTRYHPGGHVYIGIKPQTWLGVELGHSWTNNNKKELIVNAGDTVFDEAVSVNSVTEGSVRFKNTHVDLNSMCNFTKDTALIFSIGLGLSTQKIEVVTNPANTLIGGKLDVARGKSRFIGRLGLGVENKFYVKNLKNLKWRFIMRYQTLSKVRTRETAITGQPFKDSITASLGVNWTF